MKKIAVLILAFLGIFFLSESVQAEVDNGLVAYYPFNGNANDESGNGYDGIANGETWTEDRFGNADSAYELDGSSSNINLGDNFDTYQSMTIAAWVYLKAPVDNSGDPFSIIGKMNQSNGKTFSLYWVPNGNYFSLRFYGDSSCTSDNCWVGGTSEATFFEESWHFVTGTFENGTAKLYVDGVLESETDSSLSIANTSNDTIIGSYSDDRGYFHGKIDQVRIYNRALSEVEIHELSAPAPLIISKIGTGDGTVSSSPAGINCGADCEKIFTDCTDVTLTAQADDCSKFVGWAGDTECLDNSECVIAINDTVNNLIADFQKIYTPYNPGPVDGAKIDNSENNVIFSWNTGDSGNDMTFDFYLRKKSDQEKEMSKSDQTILNFEKNILKQSGFEKNVVYEWKVTSKDNGGNTYESPWWSFEFTDVDAAYYTGTYRNLIKERGIVTDDSAIKERCEVEWKTLFEDNKNNSSSIYHENWDDTAYIVNDGESEADDDDYVCSEGMSYAMMIAVQMNQKKIFDRLWNWAQKNMQHSDGDNRSGYFAWKCNIDGTIVDPNPAPDGEEYFITALIFASNRWGNGEGIYDYQYQANKILNALLNKEDPIGTPKSNGIYNVFNWAEKQVVFSPWYDSAKHTDPSYHLPAFYELWARWSSQDENDLNFWKAVSSTSRNLFENAAYSETDLFPDYSYFTGTPYPSGGHDHFKHDAWRVICNIAMDYALFGRDDRQKEMVKNVLDFFKDEKDEKDDYTQNYNIYTGNSLNNWAHSDSEGFVAMNAVGCLALPIGEMYDYVEEFWNTHVPFTKENYYDAMLYMLGLLHVTGNFKIYLEPVNDHPDLEPVNNHPDVIVPAVNLILTVP